MVGTSIPRAPLPPELARFLASGARHAVIGTVRNDGSPVTTACWYEARDDGTILLSMDAKSHRIGHLRSEPRLALTVLGDNWYNHLSLLGRAIEFRDDDDFSDIDRLAQRYLGKPYYDRTYRGVSVIAQIERWHVFGRPAAEGSG